MNELTEHSAMIPPSPAPLVSVGIPTYNRAEGLKKTLECITAQSFRNLEIIVSDNCSPGTDTENIVNEFRNHDSRIHYFRRETNRGPAENFAFVLMRATGQFFMWASDDDEWDENFIESCVSLLSYHSRTGMAFCNIVNIDTFGRIIREYPTFAIFSGVAGRETISRYLNSPEFFGKANLIYSLYRVETCKKAHEACPLTDHWGSDMCFVLGALARGGICIDSRVLFRKRIVRETDTLDYPEKILVRKYDSGTYDLLHVFSYIRNNLRAVKGTPYYWLTLGILLKRLPMSFMDLCLRPLYAISRKWAGRGE
ncbi:MAG: glycosyltransferase [Methanoregula sp.]|nr:glycosyltransferase [Methanoregula sp.]